MDILDKYEKVFNVSVDVMLKIPKIYDSYKARAKRNKLDFTVPFSIFDKLLKEPCYFCKIKKDMNIAGIDRVDNTKGYVSGNCIPCCWDCNRAKSNKTMSQYYDYLKRFNKDLPLSSSPITIHWEKK